MYHRLQKNPCAFLTVSHIGLLFTCQRLGADPDSSACGIMAHPFIQRKYGKKPSPIAAKSPKYDN